MQNQNAYILVPGRLQNIVFPSFQRQQCLRAAACTPDENKQVLQGNQLQEDGTLQHAAFVQNERICPEPVGLVQDSSWDQILRHGLH